MGDNALHDIAAGSVGGVLQAITGHPLDLIKTRVQNASSVAPRNAYQVATELVHQEGVSAFFKGVSSPLIFCGAMNATLFSVNTMSRQVVRRFYGAELKTFGTKHVILSTWLTSPFYSIVVTPMEVLKVKLQIQRESGSAARYSGFMDCCCKIFKEEGLYGFFKGYGPVVGMRLVGLPFYFGTYDLCLKALCQSRGNNENENNTTPLLNALVSGGVAGLCFWSANFPLDVIKTRIQTSSGQKTNIGVVVSKIYANGGLRSFYRGIIPCLLRAVPANAAAFGGVEMTRGFLRPKKMSCSSLSKT